MNPVKQQIHGDEVQYLLDNDFIEPIDWLQSLKQFFINVSYYI